VLRRRKRDSARKKTLALTGISAAIVSGLGLLRKRTRETGPAAGNKAVIREIFEETWQGDVNVVDRLVGSEYIGYDPSQPDAIRGIDGIKAFVERFRQSFSNTHITIEEQIAEGDTVATRWTGRGTHTGEITGIAPTGKDVTITGTSISRLENGKLIEDYTEWDMFGMLVQLGAMPAAGTAVREGEQHERYEAHERPEVEHHQPY
jgi:predicted ester cyclase